MGYDSIPEDSEDHERGRILHFVFVTEERIRELKAKPRLDQAETYELDMCIYDHKRATDYLKRTEATP